eukprot:1136981-Pelagomonas_calceolata.AAC.2
MGLLSRLETQQKYLSAKSKKLHNSNMLITPPHTRSALHKWCMVSAERVSNPLEFDDTYNTHFSTNCLDQPPSCYGALVKCEEGDSKEEVPGSNPCAGVEIKMPSIGGSLWETLSLMHAAERHA